MNVELRHLRYFVAVAREGNFTRAAEILHMAQPPLSRQVQQLEDEMRLVLIERGSRPLRLSEAGRLFYEQAVQVLERVDEMRASVEVFTKPTAIDSVSDLLARRCTANCRRLSEVIARRVPTWRSH